MRSARQLYLYAMSLVSLGAIGVGLTLLLDVFVTSSGLLWHPVGSDAGGREDLSRAIATLVIALPVWTIHWWIIRRGMSHDRPDHEQERTSVVRAVFLTLVQWISLVIWVPAAAGLLAILMSRAIGLAVDLIPIDPTQSLTSAIVGFGIWLAHTGLRRNDLQAGPIEGAAAWLPRIYLYGITLNALISAIAYLSSAATTFVGWRPAADFASNADKDFIQGEALNSLLLFVAWGFVWAWHYRYASRLVHADDWRGGAERASRVRFAALILTIVVAVTALIAALGATVQGVVAVALGVYPPYTDPPALRGFLPLVSAIPWAIVWLAYSRALHREPAAVDPIRAAQQRRLELHGVAAAALAFGAVGLGWLIGLGIDFALRGNRTAPGLDPQANWELLVMVPYAVLGMALWAWQWTTIVSRRRGDPESEGTSTIRRAFLFLAIAVALIVTLGSATLVLYRIVGSMIDLPLGENSVSEFSTMLGALLASVTVLVYHGMLLRRDQALRTLVEPIGSTATQPSAVMTADLTLSEQAADTPETVAQASVRRRFELVGPVGGDLEAAIDAARQALPEGFELNSAAD